MDCDDASERLPWLHAGTLDGRETAEVRRHLETCARCRDELDETRRAAAVFGAHLPTAVLLDLAWDRPVTALADELVQAHLESCADCREELALARESRRLEPAADGPPGAVLRPTRWSWRAAALPATLAAGLAAGAFWGRGTAPPPPAGGGADAERVGSLEIEIARLRATVTDLEARVRAAASPRLNLPIFELLPGTLVERGGSGGGNPVAIPKDADEIALLLAADGPAGDPVGLVLAEASGREVWRGAGLRHGPPGGYVVTLPAGLLPDGTYVVTLRPSHGPEVTYRLRVRRAS
jgi:hypothetical protein